MIGPASLQVLAAHEVRAHMLGRRRFQEFGSSKWLPRSPGDEGPRGLILHLGANACGEWEMEIAMFPPLRHRAKRCRTAPPVQWNTSCTWRDVNCPHPCATAMIDVSDGGGVQVQLNAHRPPRVAFPAGAMEGGGGDGGGGSAAEAATWRLPWWLAPWSVRSFSFSGALDPLIAVAALNLAATTHRARLAANGGDGAGAVSRRGLSGGPMNGLRVYDPCVGSGTILAAALALGAARVTGSDMNGEFVGAVRGNLGAAGLLPADVELFEHDTTVPLPAERHARLLPPAIDLIVSNPPWGKNIGAKEDGEPIVRSLVRHARNVRAQAGARGGRPGETRPREGGSSAGGPTRVVAAAGGPRRALHHLGGRRRV